MDEHPYFTIEDWQLEVARGDTKRGYADWVEAQKEENPIQEVLIKIRWYGSPEGRTDFGINLCEHIVYTFNDDGSIVACYPDENPP